MVKNYRSPALFIDFVTISVVLLLCLVAIFVLVELFKLSGLSQVVASFLSPALQFLGIPSELVEFMVIRPFSGSGSMAILSELYATYGADSYVSRCASVIVSSTDTVFYIIAVYFSTTQIKKLKGTILLALLSCFIGSILACLICKFI